MMQSEGKRWIELFHQRETLEGTKIVRLLKHLATSQYVLNANYQQLYNLIISYEQDLFIWAVENRPRLGAFQKEFLRLLHNYLASIFSLIEHTRKFCKDLNNQEFEKNYRIELKELKINNCIRFLKDLRTYTQHYKLPFVSATFSFKATSPKKGTVKQKLILHKNGLLEWEKWSSESKEYMKKYGEKIDLKLIVSQYQQLITRFYKHVYKRVIELYSEEIQEFLKIESELIKLQKSQS